MRRSPEMLIHALAQLPGEARLELATPPDAPAWLGALARAYGVENRCEQRPGRVVEARFSGATGAPPESGATLGELVHALTPAGDRNPVRKGDDGVFAGQRIVLVTNLPAPYRLPLFALMAERLAAAGATFRVIFAGAQAQGRPWMGAASELGFDHEIGRGTRVALGRPRSPVVTLDLARRLRAFGPTLILSGGLSPLMSGRAAAFARRRGVPFGVWDGDIPGASPGPRARAAVRRWIVAQAAFAVAYGSRSAQHLRGLGDCPLVIGRNASAFAEGDRGDSGRDVVELVAVGDLNGPRKGIDILVDAIRAIPDAPCRLTVAGGGELLEALRERAAGDERVRLLGARPHAEVVSLLAGADVSLFPTRRDVFGLALGEGMGSGLATLTTRAPGAADDLAVDGETCLVLEDGAPSTWAAAIERIVADAGLRRRLGATGAAAVRGRWTLEHAADAMLAGMRLGLERPR